MFILVDVGRRIPPWAAVAGRTFFWPGAALTFGNIWGLGDLTSWWPLSAIMQRVMAVLMVGWLIVLAVRATGFESAPASVAEPTSA